MPTPDASQFTQLKKYSAAIASRNETQPQKRTITRTMQPLPSVLHPLKFLPSFTNKYTTATNFVPINRVTGIQAKTKVPGGHVFGDSDEMLPSGTTTYDETNVTNASFTNDGVTISESITANSPFTYYLYGVTNRYGHYFNLNSLSSDYTYTFETTGANFGIKNNDTVIALFNTQNKDRINDNENGILNSWDDDGGQGPLSKLTDISISGNWCLVVAPYDEVRTGTFTLKITRTTITAP